MTHNSINEESDVIKTPEIKTDSTAATDLTITTGIEKTLVLESSVWNDAMYVPTALDFGGASDPTLVVYTPTGAGLPVRLYEFAKDDIGFFTVQIPHTYKEGTNLHLHLHWTPGSRGVDESGNTVGWKVDYSWANINGIFGAMQTADLSDVCDGTNDKHQMTPTVIIDSSTVPGTISLVLLCTVKRTDTGTDDTWASTTSGQLPLLLGVDFHHQIDTAGSRTPGIK